MFLASIAADTKGGGKGKGKGKDKTKQAQQEVEVKTRQKLNKIQLPCDHGHDSS